jgi:hypothetical protein
MDACGRQLNIFISMHVLLGLTDGSCRTRHIACPGGESGTEARRRSPLPCPQLRLFTNDGEPKEFSGIHPPKEAGRVPTQYPA